jgi:hypothetical protein
MKGIKIAHWIATALVCLLMSASAGMYIFNHEEVRDTFDDQLGFPTWLIYPMAVAKISAVIMLLTKFNNSLTDWAYAGLTFNILLAIGAHVSVNDDQALPAAVALLLILTSYFTWKRLSKEEL